MTWGMVAVGAATLIGGYMSNKSSKDAANKAAGAAGSASQMSIDEQRREYDQSREDQQPFLNAGYDSLNRQQAALDGDWSGFENSPDYAYARDQMVQGMDRSAAAHGRLMSGGYGVDMATNLNGLADQNFNNYWNRLANRAGQGQVSANNLGSLGQGMANSISNAYTNAGNARASAYQQIGQNNADFWTGTTGALTNLGMNYLTRKGGG